MSQRHSSKSFACAAAVLSFASGVLALGSPAQAEMKPRVLVPPPAVEPGPAVNGSWRVDGLLYDRFRLAVRLNPYGGGRYDAKVSWWETCSGGLSWSQSGNGRITMRLQASRCSGASGTWSADKLVCSANGGYHPAKYEPKVYVPTPPIASVLSCTYLPGSAYYSPTWVSLRRG